MKVPKSILTNDIDDSPYLKGAFDDDGTPIVSPDYEVLDIDKMRPPPVALLTSSYLRWVAYSLVDNVTFDSFGQYNFALKVDVEVNTRFAMDQVGSPSIQVTRDLSDGEFRKRVARPVIMCLSPPWVSGGNIKFPEPAKITGLVEFKGERITSISYGIFELMSKKTGGYSVRDEVIVHGIDRQAVFPYSYPLTATEIGDLGGLNLSSDEVRRRVRQRHAPSVQVTT